MSDNKKSGNDHPTKQSGHKHAALMAEYAKDAATMEEPGELWEFKSPSFERWTRIGKGASPSWHPDNEYRRKPQPLEVWVNLYSGHEAGFAHTTEAEAREVAGSDARRIAVHMREVTD